MSTLRKWILFALILCVVCPMASPQAEERGECDASQARESLRLVYIAESRKEDETIVRVTLPCTNETVEVKKCSVEATRIRNSQRYCYPSDGKPQYFEYTDLLEYWEHPERAGVAR